MITPNLARLAPSASPARSARTIARFTAGHASTAPAHGESESPTPTRALAAAGAANLAPRQLPAPVSSAERKDTESASGAARMLHVTASAARTAVFGSASGASAACAAALKVVGDRRGSWPRSAIAKCWVLLGSLEKGPGLPRGLGAVWSVELGGGTRAKKGASSVSTAASAPASGLSADSPPSPEHRAATACSVRSARDVVPGSPCFSSHRSLA